MKQCPYCHSTMNDSDVQCMICGYNLQYGQFNYAYLQQRQNAQMRQAQQQYIPQQYNPQQYNPQQRSTQAPQQQYQQSQAPLYNHANTSMPVINPNENLLNNNKKAKGNKPIGKIIFWVLALILLTAVGNTLKNGISGNTSSNNSVIDTGNITVIDKGKSSYYDITYESFINKIAKPLAFAANSSESTVKSVSLKTEPQKTTCDFYKGSVYGRRFTLEAVGKLEVMYIEIYTTIDDDKIIGVFLFKANGEASLDRFNMLANYISDILSGIKLSDIGKSSEYEFKTDTDSDIQTHYIRYSDSEIIFVQQDNTLDPLGSDNKMRKMTIYPKQNSNF